MPRRQTSPLLKLSHLCLGATHASLTSFQALATMFQRLLDSELIVVRVVFVVVLRWTSHFYLYYHGLLIASVDSLFKRSCRFTMHSCVHRRREKEKEQKNKRSRENKRKSKTKKKRQKKEKETWSKEELAHKRQLALTVYSTPLMTPTTDLGLSTRVLMFEFVRLVTGTFS